MRASTTAPVPLPYVPLPPHTVAGPAPGDAAGLDWFVGMTPCPTPSPRPTVRGGGS